MWRNVWTSWAESEGLKGDIVKYEAKELDERLSRFFAEIRKSEGFDHELDSLRVMLAALDRHLKHNDSKISIAKDRRRIRQVQTGPEGKSKSSSRKRPFKTSKCKTALAVEENRVLSEQTPKPLLYTLRYLFTLHFGLRGCKEQHEISAELVTDVNLNDYRNGP